MPGRDLWSGLQASSELTACVWKRSGLGAFCKDGSTNRKRTCGKLWEDGRLNRPISAEQRKALLEFFEILAHGLFCLWR